MPPHSEDPIPTSRTSGMRMAKRLHRCTPSTGRIHQEPPDHSGAIGFNGRSKPSRTPDAPGLPLDQLTPPDSFVNGELHCATTTVDVKGRLGSRSTLRALEWIPGQPVSLRTDRGLLIARAAERARWAVGATGYLHLPATMRRECDIGTGDHVFLAAVVDHALLVVYSLPVLEEALAAQRADLWGRRS